MTQLSCKDTRLYLLAHLDDELDARTSLDVQNHLEHCTECAAEGRALARETKALKSALGSESVGGIESLRARVQDALAQAEREEVARAGRRSWWRGSLALAASALLAVGFYLGVLSPGTLRASGFTDRHHGCVHALEDAGHAAASPSDSQAGENVLARLRAAGISGERLAAMEGAGWRFGNAHKCRVGGRNFLHVYFTRGAETASLFLPLDEGTEKDLELLEDADTDDALVRRLPSAVAVAADDSTGRALVAMLK